MQWGRFVILPQPWQGPQKKSCFMLYLDGTSQPKVSGARCSEEGADNMNKPEMNFLFVSIPLLHLHLSVVVRV